MTRTGNRLLVVLAMMSFVAAPASSQDAMRDVFATQFFEPGLAGDGASPHAAAATAKMDFVVGAWVVTLKNYAADTLRATGEGYSRITYVNRGHGFMEQFASDDFDGAGGMVREIRLLAAQAGAGTSKARWLLGAIDSFTETVSIADGHIRDDGALVVQRARRVGGGVVLTNYRTTIRKTEAGFVAIVETSQDHGMSWQRHTERRYLPAPAEAAAGAGSVSGFGAPNAERQKEAADFDFLVGSWSSQNSLARPGGQPVQWPANALAGHVLDGNAVLEYVWFDLDPSLPDAATTIVRIYNRNMQRWECLYLANRGNGMLHFGGVRQGDEIVLTTFGVGASNRISRFVFYDMERNAYSWYAESSSDRGATWARTWEIEYARQ